MECCIVTCLDEVFPILFNLWKVTFGILITNARCVVLDIAKVWKIASLFTGVRE